jgi:hypothetical protein
MAVGDLPTRSLVIYQRPENGGVDCERVATGTLHVLPVSLLLLLFFLLPCLPALFESRETGKQ